MTDPIDDALAARMAQGIEGPLGEAIKAAYRLEMERDRATGRLLRAMATFVRATQRRTRVKEGSEEG